MPGLVPNAYILVHICTKIIEDDSTSWAVIKQVANFQCFKIFHGNLTNLFLCENAENRTLKSGDTYTYLLHISPISNGWDFPELLASLCKARVSERTMGGIISLSVPQYHPYNK